MKKQKAKPNVLTCGIWDLMHLGHIRFLKRCAEHGNLIVGVATDDYMKRYKGREAVETYEERAEKISSLRFVHKVVPHDEANSIKVYDDENIKVLFICDDYNFTQSHFDRLKEAIKRDIQIKLLPRTEGISTTSIKERMKKVFEDEQGKTE